MFRGRYHHTIDPKGRLSIPARFREELAERGTDTLVLTEGDHCIWAYPMDEWQRLEQELERRPQLAPEMRNFLRISVGGSKECPVDKAGRALIPPDLREFAGLQKDIVIVGVLKHFEIWSRERWNDHYQQLRANFDQSASKLGEMGL